MVWIRMAVRTSGCFTCVVTSDLIESTGSIKAVWSMYLSIVRTHNDQMVTEDGMQKKKKKKKKDILLNTLLKLLVTDQAHF